MAGTRAVAARVRLAKRLQQQQTALSAAARCQDAVDSARVRAQELAVQGASLVTAAEKALGASIAKLVEVMGSAASAAAVLDIEVTAVRKAMTTKPARPTPGPRSVAPRADNASRGDVAVSGPKTGSSPVEAVHSS
jgi:hypothetical protein